MAAFITPTMILASGGFIQGKGIGVSPEFLANANSYGISGLSGEFRTAYTAEQEAWDNWDGSSEPAPTDPGAVGSITYSATLIPFWGPAADTAITNAKAAAAVPFLYGIAGFASKFGQLAAFCATSFQFMGAMSQASSTSFSDLGTGVKGFGDLATGGVSASFPNPSGIALGLSQLGKSVDVAQIDSLSSPGLLAKSVIDNELGTLGGLAEKLEAAGLTPEDLEDPASADVIMRILRTIGGPDLQTIIKGLELTPHDPAKITSLADVMNLQLMLPPAAPGVVMPTADQLSKSFQNVGGTYKDASEVIGFLNKIEIPPLSRLSDLKSPLPPEIQASMTPQMGRGSGPFGNPTILDIIGSAAGYTHTAAIKQMSAVSSQIGSSLLGKELSEALLTGDAEEVYLATLAISTSTNAQLQSQIAAGTESLAKMQDQLATEQFNLGKSGVNLYTAVTPDVSQLMTFGTSLHAMGVDKEKLGTNFMFENIALNDVYGDAVKACLLEGRNSDSLSQSGVTNPIFMDAEKQAQKLLG